ILAHRGELVLVARAVRPGVDAREHAAAHQMREPAREDVARDRQLGREVGVPARAEHRLAHDQERPPVPDHLERSGDRTVLPLEAMAHTIWLHEKTRLSRLQKWTGSERPASCASATAGWKCSWTDVAWSSFAVTRRIRRRAATRARS